MRRAIAFLVMIGFCWTLQGSATAAGPHVFGTFALFHVDPAWAEKSQGYKRRATLEAKSLVASFKNRVALDAYWTYGLTTGAHFMLRLHSEDLQSNQQLLTQLMTTDLGKHLHLTFTITGVTKGLNYATQFPDLLAQLKAASYEGAAPAYAVMIPTKKSSDWWNQPEGERVAMIKEHTLPTLAYLKTVKRKLYHATGLADADFVTIFETNDLVAFNDLLISLRMVREDRYNERLGSPTVLGTIMSWEEILNVLKK